MSEGDWLRNEIRRGEEGNLLMHYSVHTPTATLQGITTHTLTHTYTHERTVSALKPQTKHGKHTHMLPVSHSHTNVYSLTHPQLKLPYLLIRKHEPGADVLNTYPHFLIS